MRFLNGLIGLLLVSATACTGLGQGTWPAGNGHGPWTSLLQAASDTDTIKAAASTAIDAANAKKTACVEFKLSCVSHLASCATLLGTPQFFGTKEQHDAFEVRRLQLLNCLADLGDFTGFNDGLNAANEQFASGNIQYGLGGYVGYDNACYKFLQATSSANSSYSSYNARRPWLQQLYEDIVDLEKAIDVYSDNMDP